MNQVIITVSQLNRYLKSIVEDSPILHSVCVRGEISNYVKYNKSGHIYMTLKDEQSSIKVVIFNRTAQTLKVPLENGMTVIVYGKITVYERDGGCQIIASSVRPEGLGDIYIQLQELKDRLNKEGLFAPEHKKAIPKFPRKLGVVTSASGAALQDIRNTVSQRYPLVELVVYPVLVQGKEAVPEICRAVSYFSASDVDTVLIARGGGSAEDLFVFNNETLARIVYHCPIPVISAVGHETDVSVLDLVADARASTPTHGAMLATPDRSDLIQYLTQQRRRLTSDFIRFVQRRENALAVLISRPCLSSAGYTVAELERNLAQIRQRLENGMVTSLREKEKTVQLMAVQLNAFNPLETLSRGYAVLYHKGKASDGTSVLQGDHIVVRTEKKYIEAEVTNIREVRENE